MPICVEGKQPLYKCKCQNCGAEFFTDEPSELCENCSIEEQNKELI